MAQAEPEPGVPLSGNAVLHPLDSVLVNEDQKLIENENVACENGSVRSPFGWIRFSSIIVLVAIAGYLLVALLLRRPILLHTLGEWDCACGDMLIKTTRRSLWNPFRDRTPENRAYDFLANLRAGNCPVDLAWCADVLAKRRVSGWRLAYREDGADGASLYFRLTKYGDGPPNELGGVGVIDVHRGTSRWMVTGYDSYF
jgi:hypothetical protein